MSSGLATIAATFARAAPSVESWSVRVVDDHYQGLHMRQGVLEPPVNHRSRGAMVSVAHRGGWGYAATSELGPGGARAAFDRALAWARETAGITLVNPTEHHWPDASGRYQSPSEREWSEQPLADKIACLHVADRAMDCHSRIVDRSASIGHRRSRTAMLASTGARTEQSFDYVSAGVRAVANEGSNTQSRSHGGIDAAGQGGLERLAAFDFASQATRAAEEALELLDARDCPSGATDLLLMPSQMALQIHESIGHPLELDRILGDERNYAGTSFVTMDMLGQYRYGSELLNVTFDPHCPGELASYAYDDEGSPAEHAYIIRDGILERTLGGAVSQRRAGAEGVANARACSWNRPPIDRMANLNVEPGAETLDEMIAGVEHGVLMDTNRSWSIDDSRNKFQFGCEYARLIKDGELGPVVKNPSYRGISATFWRSLAGVGNRDTFTIMGVGTCGKGEPNQAIHVGHASPACLFRGVDVFGTD